MGIESQCSVQIVTGSLSSIANTCKSLQYVSGLPHTENFWTHWMKIKSYFTHSHYVLTLKAYLLEVLKILNFIAAYTQKASKFIKVRNPISYFTIYLMDISACWQSKQILQPGDVSHRHNTQREKGI